jgi:SAM-dependent methyltransferase
MTDRAARLRELAPYFAEGRAIEGWTLAHRPTPLGDPPPWDYEQRARELAAKAKSVLDLGTGGGEVLSRILPGYAGRAVATEEWGRNAPVAARLLAPLGVGVLQANSYQLPFGAGQFDLVLDRHEALRPAEVARVLAPGGTVLTQQIGSDWYDELREAFPRMASFEPHHVTYPLGFEAAGLTIVSMQRHMQAMAFEKLGQIVYTMALAPWSFPDFELEADLDGLLEFEHNRRKPEGVILTDTRYMLEARQPNN